VGADGWAVCVCVGEVWSGVRGVGDGGFGYAGKCVVVSVDRLSILWLVKWEKVPF